MRSSSNADLASKWVKVEDHYKKKLWNLLTVQLQSIIKEPSIMQDNLIPMYKEFIVAFIQNVSEKVKMNNEAFAMMKVLMGRKVTPLRAAQGNKGNVIIGMIQHRMILDIKLGVH